MKVDGHTSVARARVRGHEMPRHAVAKLSGGRAWVTTCPIGLPRLWRRVADNVLEGLESGLSEASSELGTDKLTAAVNVARDRLTAGCDGLVERMAPDATLLAILVEHGELHVLSAGPARAYLHRKGRPRRLTPREDEETGLRMATPALASTHLEPGDLVLAGSVSAFSTDAIDKVASVLERDPTTPASVLCSLLTDPAREAGVGGAAIVLRAR